MTQPPQMPRLSNLTRPEFVLGALAILSVPAAVIPLLALSNPFAKAVSFILCLAVGILCLTSIWGALVRPYLHRIKAFDDVWSERSDLQSRLVESESLLAQMVGAEYQMEYSIVSGAQRSDGFVIYLEARKHPFPTAGEIIHIVDPYSGYQSGVAVATSKTHQSRFLVATIDPARNQIMAGMIAEADGDSSKFNTKSIGVVLVSNSPRSQVEEPQYV